MKAKHVFTTLGLALTMGLGVAAGLSHVKEFKQAKADGSSTVYCKMTYDWWKADSAAIGVHYWGGASVGTSWPGKRGTLVNGETDVWKFSVPSDITGLIFTRVNGGTGTVADWGAKTGDLTLPTDGKNLYTITSSSAVWGDPGVAGEWSSYVEPSPATTYSVDVYVDGVKVGTEDVDEGKLPAIPNLAYGEGFDGWYSNIECTGDKVTGITSNTSVYGEIITLPEWQYKYDLSRVDDVFKNELYLYAFEDDGARVNHTWPGLKVTGNQIQLPSDAEFVLVDVKDEVPTAQTVDITQSHAANDTIRVLTSKTGDKYNAVFTSTLDEPDEDGYYLMSDKVEMTYDNGVKMTFNDDYSPLDADGNIAVLYNYHAEVDEEVKVRSFINDVDSWHSVTTDPYSFGSRVTTGLGTGNFKFSKAGNYDFFYKGGVFYIAEAKERYTVTVYNVLFEGSHKASQVAGTNQLATEDVVFNPTHDDVANYRYLETYTDAELEDEYVPVAPTGNMTIYQKYMRLGYYLCGLGGKWSVEDAQYAPASGGNHAVVEGLVLAASTPLKFYDYENDVWYGYSALGADFSSFVTEGSDDNIVFAAGTYSLYLNSENKIYIEAGLNSYMTTFLAKMAEVCDASEGLNTDKVGLANNWSALASAYAHLDEDDQSTLKNAHADPNSTHNEEVVAAAYDYIYTKYHTELSLANFMNRSFVPGANTSMTINQSNNVVLYVLVIATISVISAAGLFLVIRRRKHN